MHKMERLLQTLAPKGVEFRKLGEVCEIIRGKRVTKKEILDKGKYPVVSGGIGFMGYLNEYNREENTITIAQYGTAGFVNWQNQKFWANDVCFSVIPKETLINRYLYYVLTNMQNYLYSISNRSAIPYSISSNNIMQITIPIPPLEIQQEIVKILDAFTELNTELNTRKKQYEYYQNMLLDFKGINQSHKDAKEKLAQKTYPKRLKTLLQTLAPKGVEFRKLGEVLEYDQPNKYCVTSKEFDKSYPTPVLTAGKTFILGYTNEKDNIYQASKSSPVIIFDDFTTATQWVDFPFKVKSSAMKILLPKNPTINIRFIFFYMQTIPYNISGEHTRQWISRYSQITIPIPPLEIQQEIVKILDQFSVLTTDLLAGIPAEIEARKKQYEYYREKLLTFKPLTPHKEVKE
ncbi:restriction endonuclease subunit S [Helicobacter pylori]|uniref:restriction endonuclease subunit S n=1 Tax=Helicobacter pylori TaxID=210 RepID=UPI00287BC23C|nr:restriction endonuclease subunit S [Helicobacter pylori]WNE31999.1 restriction endonuclease subunit S [Helicobacter pylori]WNE33423.1 restriction endonuclease subunit S [Helicobacter pylori]WNE34851.1 restriction endonuclease subunit S [Helicobacter pylori]WNE36275.1 restriction endonuclease subunit S [Helicobacter pylori]WNE37703.1 restriction endonuclease subunit S [Helicobacter pylori]